MHAPPPVQQLSHYVAPPQLAMRLHTEWPRNRLLCPDYARPEWCLRRRSHCRDTAPSTPPGLLSCVLQQPLQLVVALIVGAIAERQHLWAGYRRFHSAVPGRWCPTPSIVTRSRWSQSQRRARTWC